MFLPGFYSPNTSGRDSIPVEIGVRIKTVDVDHPPCMSGNRNHSRSRVAAWAELTGDDVPEAVREDREARDGDRGRDG